MTLLVKEHTSTSIRLDKSPSKTTDELFRDYIDTEDPRRRDELILAHQNLVRYLASKFANRGIPLEDLAQVGMIGLVNAVDRFDPDRGIKFSTFATPTIVGEIRRYFRDKAWSLKVPRRLQELNLTISKVTEELTKKLCHPPTIQDIMEAIGTSEEETIEAMELGNAYDTVSLDTRIESGGESAPMSLAEFVGEEDASLQKLEEHGDLMHAINSLDPRDKAVIYYRFFQELSQTQVAERLNISQMHVSRIQQKALAKLKLILSS